VALRQQNMMVYICDNCGTQVMLDGVMGGPLGGPTNWKSVTPQTTFDGDWFCGYECLGRWALDKAAQRQAHLEAVAAQAEDEVD